ncbi:MAG TPA: hypothetical protein VNG69_10350 [Casimicrobiaceae bacterium]|nr:hypothetical protein [Casimicrobiaceae bacterium]
MASIGALVTMSTVLAAPPTYTATRIVGPPGTAVNGTANNRAGDIVGWTAPLGTNLGRPFLFSGGARIDFEALGGPTGFAGDINDAGAIVGVADIPSGVDHAFVRSNGVVRDIHPAGARSSFAQAINDAGAIVGGYVDAAGIFQGFLLQGTALTTLPTLGGNTTLANSINEAGIVVGYSRNAQNQTRPFRYSGGTMTDLGTFGGNNGVALGINERGDIVGYAESAGSPARGFLSTLMERLRRSARWVAIRARHSTSTTAAQSSVNRRLPRVAIARSFSPRTQ